MYMTYNQGSLSFSGTDIVIVCLLRYHIHILSISEKSRFILDISTSRFLLFSDLFLIDLIYIDWCETLSLYQHLTTSTGLSEIRTRDYPHSSPKLYHYATGADYVFLSL